MATFDSEQTMPTTTLSSREFNQDTGKAKRAAKQGPVFITDRGQPAYVLMSIKDYQKLSAQQPSIIDLLAMTDADAVDFEAPKLKGKLYHPADLS